MASRVVVRNIIVIVLWWALWLCLVYWEVRRGVSPFQQGIYYVSIPLAFFAVWWANHSLFGEVEVGRRIWLVVGVSALIWLTGVFLGIVLGVNFKFAIGGRI